MADDDTDSPNLSPSPTVNLLGGGLKGTTSLPRLFPGDLVCYRASKPYEWLPWYGIVLSPNDQMVKYFVGQNKKKSLTLNPKLSQVGPTSEKAFTLPHGPSISAPFPVGGKEPSGVEIPEGISLAEGDDSGSVISIPEEGLSDPIYVNWTHTHRVAVIPRSEIALVDRNLLRGQRVKNEDGVEGTVMSRVTKATLQVINTNHVIDNVPAKYLNPVSPFVHGREIQYQGWIGIITNVRRHITYRLDNGGFVFSLKSNETDSFMKQDPFWGLGIPCPGMRNKFAPTVMKEARFVGPMMRFVHRWVRPLSYFYTRSSSTTLAVETSSVDVLWLQKCPNSPNASENEPSGTLEKKALMEAKALGLPSHETFSINSVRMYGTKADDAVSTYTHWYAGFQAKFFGGPTTSFAKFLLTPSSINNLLNEGGYELPCKVIFRQTEVEVEWDNGISEYMLAARVPRLLIPPDPESDVNTGFIVVSSNSDQDGDNKYGIVICHKSEPGKVRVRWLIIGGEKEEDVIDLGDSTSDTSELKPHPSLTMPHRGLTVFLQNNPEGYETGTVVDLDLRQGKVLVAVPESPEPLAVYAHLISPVAKRCHWNFHTRGWVLESVNLRPGEMVNKDIFDEETDEEEDLIEMEESDDEKEEVGEIKLELIGGKEGELQGNEEVLAGEEEDNVVISPEVGDVAQIEGKELEGEEEESKTSIEPSSVESRTETDASCPTSGACSLTQSASTLPQEAEKEEEIIPVGVLQEN